MSKPEAAGEPSMEEILASIRKIISEEPVYPRSQILADAARPGAPSHTLDGSDAHDDYDLPSMLRAKPQSEKPAALMGRIADAIRGGAPAPSSPPTRHQAMPTPTPPLGPSHPVRPPAHSHQPTQSRDDDDDIASLISNDLGDLLDDGPMPPASAPSFDPLAAAVAASVAERFAMPPPPAPAAMAAPAPEPAALPPLPVEPSARADSGSRFGDLRPLNELLADSVAAPAPAEPPAMHGKLPGFGQPPMPQTPQPAPQARHAQPTPDLTAPAAPNSLRHGGPLPPLGDFVPRRTETEAPRADAAPGLPGGPERAPSAAPASAVPTPEPPAAARPVVPQQPAKPVVDVAPAAPVVPAPPVQRAAPVVIAAMPAEVPAARSGPAPTGPVVLASMEAVRTEPRAPAAIPATAQPAVREPTPPPSPPPAGMMRRATDNAAGTAAVPAEPVAPQVIAAKALGSAPEVIARLDPAPPPAVSKAAAPPPAPSKASNMLPPLAAPPSVAAPEVIAASPVVAAPRGEPVATPRVDAVAVTVDAEAKAAVASALGALAAGFAASSIKAEAPAVTAEKPPMEAAKTQPEPAKAPVAPVAPAASAPAAAPVAPAAATATAVNAEAPSKSAPSTEARPVAKPASAPVPAIPVPATAPPAAVGKPAATTVAQPAAAPSSPVQAPAQAKPLAASAAPAEPKLDALGMLATAIAAAPKTVVQTTEPAPKTGTGLVPASQVAVAIADGGERTLDDTVAELLRPMLRQWLADNMPRIVEKALRIEIAQNLGAGDKPKG